VDRWITHISEPSRLLLAWQGPDPHGDRTRFAVGELLLSGSDVTLRYLSGPEVEKAKKLGFQGYPAFKLDQQEHRQGVLAAFLRRLPPRARPDFDAYKAQFRLKSDLGLSDFALLAYTGARLPSDGFSVVDTLEDVRAPSELVLEIVGHRHWVAKLKSPLRVGEALDLLPEPENPVDKNAVVVKARGDLVGYVNRLQTATFHKLLREGSVEATLDRLNGSSDRPHAFMFVRVRGSNQAAA
jgi:HIRAN domain